MNGPIANGKQHFFKNQRSKENLLFLTSRISLLSSETKRKRECRNKRKRKRKKKERKREGKGEKKEKMK